MLVELIPGPSVSAMTRTAAEAGLRTHPAIRKGAAYALEQMDGRWVAAVVHEAADAPFAGGGPADSDEESAGPKGPISGDEEPSADDNGAGADVGPDEGASEETGDSSEGNPPKKHDSEKSELHELKALVVQIAEALGLPADLGSSPVPGADGPDAPPGPPGAGGPPPGPPSLHGGPAEQHVIHERVTKPGETPPGGTPIGAPAFASVRKDHPWAHIAGKVASFQVAEPIGDTPMHKIAEELGTLASEIGYGYSLQETTDEHGQRMAVALITKH